MNMNNSEDVDPKLKIARVEVFSILCAFQLPSSAYKIEKEYEDQFGSDLAYKSFGYSTLESFLRDHPKLETVVYEGKLCFRAKEAEGDAGDIQRLVQRQKKKKKRAGGKIGRGGFVRYNPASMSGRGAKMFNAPDWRSEIRRSATRYPQNPSRSTVPAFRSASSFGFDDSSSPMASGSASGLSIREGISRIRRAFATCNGRATITKLNWAYEMTNGCQFNGDEMYKYFGTKKINKIFESHLSSEITVQQIAGQYMFISPNLEKERERARKEWEKTREVVVIKPDIQNCLIPTLAKLQDGLVEMLCNVYPNTIPLNSMSEIYRRAHDVTVNPEVHYRKSWHLLVTTIFKDRLHLSRDQQVGLTAKEIEKLKRLKRIGNTAEASAANSMKKVSVFDLGFDDSDSQSDEDASFYESDDDDDLSVSSSFTDCVSTDTNNSSRMGLPEYNDEKADPEPPTVTKPADLPVSSLPPRYSRFSVPRKTAPRPPVEEKEISSSTRTSVFDRLSSKPNNTMACSDLHAGSSTLTKPSNIKQAANSVNLKPAEVDYKINPNIIRGLKSVDPLDRFRIKPILKASRPSLRSADSSSVNVTNNTAITPSVVPVQETVPSIQPPIVKSSQVDDQNNAKVTKELKTAPSGFSMDTLKKRFSNLSRLVKLAGVTPSSSAQPEAQGTHELPVEQSNVESVGLEEEVQTETKSDEGPSATTPSAACEVVQDQREDNKGEKDSSNNNKDIDEVPSPVIDSQSVSMNSTQDSTPDANNDTEAHILERSANSYIIRANPSLMERIKNQFGSVAVSKHP